MSTENITVKGKVRVSKQDSKTGKLISVGEWSENILMVEAIQHYAEKLADSSLPPSTIVGAKIGTNADPETENDGGVKNPIFTTNFIADSGLLGTDTQALQFFISATELPNNTYTEFGLLFGDEENPQPYSRALFNEPVEKSDGQDLRIEYRVTFNN